MRISRKKRPEKPLIPHFNKNEYIAVPKVRVIAADGTHMDIMNTADAVALAREQGCDLVEINPKAEPPVAQIIEFAKFKYQKEKEAKKQKANAHESDLKGIRLSLRIGEHDMNIRKTQAETFLNRGDKVRIELLLRGRERAHGNEARLVIKKFTDMLEALMPLRYDQEIQYQGGKLTAIVAKK